MRPPWGLHLSNAAAHLAKSSMFDLNPPAPAFHACAYSGARPMGIEIDWPATRTFGRAYPHEVIALAEALCEVRESLLHRDNAAGSSPSTQ